jgi:hypothetical protein
VGETTTHLEKVTHTSTLNVYIDIDGNYRFKMLQGQDDPTFRLGKVVDAILTQ